MESIKLQSIGNVPAIQASKLVAGDTTVWNFGATAKVKRVISSTRCFIVFELESEDGETYERKMKKDRLVGIKCDFDAPETAERELRQWFLDNVSQGVEFTYFSVMTRFPCDGLKPHICRAFYQLLNKGWLVKVANKAKYPIGDKYVLNSHAVKHNVGNLHKEELNNLVQYAYDNNCEVHVIDHRFGTSETGSDYNHCMELLSKAADPDLSIHSAGQQIAYVRLLLSETISHLSTSLWTEQWRDQYEQNLTRYSGEFPEGQQIAVRRILDTVWTLIFKFTAKDEISVISFDRSNLRGYKEERTAYRLKTFEDENRTLTNIKLYRPNRSAADAYDSDRILHTAKVANPQNIFSYNQ